MSRRTRRSAATNTTVPADADPDFLALTPRQQRSIDRAFDRATRPVAGPSRKRRKLSTAPSVFDVDGAGGFMDEDDGEGEGGFMDAGGFMPDDEDAGGGGFMPDDEDAGGGGFMPEEDEMTGERGDRRIPVRSLPAVLSSLNLPSDKDVLQVFRDAAAGWADDNGDGRGRKEADDEEVDLAVGLKDFRAVCAVLMGPDEGGPEGDESDRESAYNDIGGDESSILSLSEDEYREPKGKGKAKTTAAAAKGGRGKAKGKAKARAELEETGRIKLNSRQKEIVNDLWGMVKPAVPDGQYVRGGNVLGREEVKQKVRELGEMWTEDEITEMVSLFSTQHQGRGLSYDDFGAIMVRAGLA